MDFQKIADAWLADDKAVLDQVEPAKLRAVGLIAAGVEDERALEAAGADFVKAMKGTSLVRQASVVVEKADSPRSNTLSWVFSDSRPDRAGDIILQNGWDLANYKRNPVILWGHALGLDSEADVPIGRAENVRVEGDKLVGDIVFAVQESERAARIFKLASAGFIKAGSVGFRPKKVKVVQDETERNQLGLGRFGVVYESSELLEFSLCAVPCNAGALQQSLKSGALNESELELLSRLPTERDSINALRRRARSALGAASAGDSGHRDTTESTAGGALSELASAMRSFSEQQANVAEALRELLGSREEEAASRRMLARSITDLAARIGATRAVDSARSVADAGVIDEAELTKGLKKLEELIAAMSGGKN